MRRNTNHTAPCHVCRFDYILNILLFILKIFYKGHCIIPSLLLVRLGAYDITLPADNVNVIDSFITNYFLHESYDPKSISNDISILKLDRTIAVTNYVRPACIPLSNELRYKDWTGVFLFYNLLEIYLMFIISRC